MSLLSTARMYLKRTKQIDEPTDVYEGKVGLLDGGELDLGALHGKPTLIVNTASKCGYTPQYEGLQKIYERYSERGLQVLGAPSGDFADQEYDDAGEIGEFCQENYGVSFPLTERTSVRADPSPLWAELARQPGSGPPAWNFTKYLICGSSGFTLLGQRPISLPSAPIRYLVKFQAGGPEPGWRASSAQSGEGSARTEVRSVSGKLTP
jgi:glutathione peroxidase